MPLSPPPASSLRHLGELLRLTWASATQWSSAWSALPSAVRPSPHNVAVATNAAPASPGSAGSEHVLSIADFSAGSSSDAASALLMPAPSMSAMVYKKTPMGPPSLQNVGASLSRAPHTLPWQASLAPPLPLSAALHSALRLRNLLHTSSPTHTASPRRGVSYRAQANPLYIFNHAACGYPKHALNPVATAASFAAPKGMSAPSKPSKSSTPAPDQHGKSKLKSTSCGEDAFFSRFNALGVSDGVGGWSGHKNADPSLYSRTLMHYCNIELEKYDSIYFSEAFSSPSAPPSRPPSPGVATPASQQGRRQAHTLASGTVDQSAVASQSAWQQPHTGDAASVYADHAKASSQAQHSIPFSVRAVVHPANDAAHAVGATTADTASSGAAKPTESSHSSHGSSSGNSNSNSSSDGRSRLVAEPGEILQLAYEQSAQDAAAQGIVGSTTACLVVLNRDELHISNLGDCGVIVIRQNDFLFRTEEQVHSFNYPYQLGTSSGDQPADAQNFAVKVHRGDIIIVASDGVFDNVFDEEMLGIVNNHTKSLGVASWDPAKLSLDIAARAKEVSEDGRCASPFQSKALSEGLYYQGGKADDITVVVAVVREIGDLANHGFGSII